jgi:hypothetical protein
MNRRTMFAVLAGVLLAATPGVAAMAASSPTSAAGVPCGVNDHPETGVQGDVPRADQTSGEAKKGYNCGLALVGHATLSGDGRNPGSNANMAWAGHCAYVSGPGALFGSPSPKPGDGVAVIDVSSPAHPTHTLTLRSPGALATSETLHAVTTKKRSILVVGQYGNANQTPTQPMDVYDVTDCAHPKLLTPQPFIWPQNQHNLTISPNGRYVFATLPLQAVDIDPLFDGNPATGVVYLGSITDAVADALGNHPNGHEVYSNADGTRIWTGMQVLNAEAMWSVDLTKWLQRDATNAPAGPPEIVSEEPNYPGHSVRKATIGGRAYALHSDESVFGTAYGCLPEAGTPFAGPAEPYLSDYTDEHHPTMAVGKLHLAINDAANCPAQLSSKINSSSHYQDVDNEADTTFAMVSMWNSGLRVFDVRNPAAPKEVAYFNPADVGIDSTVLDQAWGHIRYVPETGQIWFGTASGGFWVVELEPQVRAHLGLGRTRALYPDGRPGHVGLTIAAVLAPPTAAAYFCALSNGLATANP